MRARYKAAERICTSCCDLRGKRICHGCFWRTPNPTPSSAALLDIKMPQSQETWHIWRRASSLLWRQLVVTRDVLAPSSGFESEHGRVGSFKDPNSGHKQDEMPSSLNPRHLLLSTSDLL